MGAAASEGEMRHAAPGLLISLQCGADVRLTRGGVPMCCRLKPIIGSLSPCSQSAVRSTHTLPPLAL